MADNKRISGIMPTTKSFTTMLYIAGANPLVGEVGGSGICLLRTGRAGGTSTRNSRCHNTKIYLLKATLPSVLDRFRGFLCVIGGLVLIATLLWDLSSLSDSWGSFSLNDMLDTNCFLSCALLRTLCRLSVIVTVSTSECWYSSFTCWIISVIISLNEICVHLICNEREKAVWVVI